MEEEIAQANDVRVFKSLGCDPLRTLGADLVVARQPAADLDCQGLGPGVAVAAEPDLALAALTEKFLEHVIANGLTGFHPNSSRTARKRMLVTSLCESIPQR